MMINRRKNILFSLWDVNGSSFVQTWIPFTKGMLCVFGWYWPSGSGDEDFKHFVNVFSLFCNYLPLEKSWALQLNKRESSSPKEALCQVWLKLDRWIWRRRRFSNFVNVLPQFLNYLPLDILRWNPSFEQTSLQIHFTQFGWNWLSGSREEHF